jgi:hypothetical protein
LATEIIHIHPLVCFIHPYHIGERRALVGGIDAFEVRLFPFPLLSEHVHDSSNFLQIPELLAL